MTDKKRKPGRPKGVRFHIQIHVFLDTETDAQLKRLARQADSISSYVRELIRREFERKPTLTH